MKHCGILFCVAYGIFLTSSPSWAKVAGTIEPMPAVRFDAEKDVLFLLYTKKNPKTAEYISVGDAASLGNFNTQRATKIVIHGWIANPGRIDSIRAAYIESGEDCNIIMVDWTKGADNVLYNVVVGHVVSVGERVAQLLNFLISKGLKLANIHLVGHSLGAHVAGVAGNRVSSGRVGRITGLDPAAPGYTLTSMSDRLDSTDAAYVEVVHTCAGILGWADNLGHSDFYPNGGKMIQPGCGTDIEEVLGMGACSHNRAPALFAESIITKKGFVGVKCSSYQLYEHGQCSSNEKALMGDKTPTSAKGAYYLKTASSSPYAEG